MVNKKKREHFLRRTLGLLSAGAIAGSLFMGYNRITGNAIATGSDLSLIGLGGILLFVLGIVGTFIVTRK